VNLHTTQLPNGEIRGQVIPISQPMAASSSVKKNIASVDFKLEQNYPNPFNPSTIVTYSISQPSQVELNVYDPLGAKVWSNTSDKKQTGVYQETIDLTSFPSGVYVTELKSSEGVQRVKMILAK
jgi:hypothetical protein